NFAHGAVYMLGGYITLTMMVYLELNYWMSILISILTVGLISVLMACIVYHPLRYSTTIQHKVNAIGILLFLEVVAYMVRRPDYREMPTPYGQAVALGGVTFTWQRLISIVSAIALMVLLYLFLKKTFTGSTIIAMAQNREGASLVGINTNKVA